MTFYIVEEQNVQKIRHESELEATHTIIKEIKYKLELNERNTYSEIKLTTYDMLQLFHHAEHSNSKEVHNILEKKIGHQPLYNRIKYEHLTIEQLLPLFYDNSYTITYAIPIITDEKIEMLYFVTLDDDEIDEIERIEKLLRSGHDLLIEIENDEYQYETPAILQKCTEIKYPNIDFI